MATRQQSDPIVANRPTTGHADSGDAPEALLTQCVCMIAGLLTILTTPTPRLPTQDAKYRRGQAALPVNVTCGMDELKASGGWGANLVGWFLFMTSAGSGVIVSLYQWMTSISHVMFPWIIPTQSHLWTRRVLSRRWDGQA